MAQNKDSQSPTADFNGDQEEDFASLFEASNQLDNNMANNGANTTTTIVAGSSPSVPTPSASPASVCIGGSASLYAFAAPAAYCVPAVSSGCSYPDIITNVHIASRTRTSTCDNLSGDNGYRNSPPATATTSITAGAPTPVAVTTDRDIEDDGV